MISRDPAPFPEGRASHVNGHEEGDGGETSDDGLSEAPEGSSENEPLPQPEESSGVRKSMATIALDRVLDRPLLKVIRKGAIPGARVTVWSALTDAEIMLRVSEGDDQGCNYLI